MRFKKALCMVLAAAMVLTPAQSVFAEGVTSGTSTVKDTDDTTLFESTSSEWSYQGDMSVTYEDNSFVADVLVTIPKSVALNETKQGTYDVTVKGEMEKALGVSVAPHDDYEDVDGVNFTMSTQGKDDVVATIVQPETVWSYKEVTAEGTTKHGTITAEDLSRGLWEGHVKFDINMGEGYGMVCDPDVLDDPDHTWNNGVCGNCGAVDTANHTHNYAEKVIKEATCSESGSRGMVCDCGEVQSSTEIAKLGHDVGEGTTCTRCGVEHTHALQETVLVAGSCSVDKIVRNVCECGYKEDTNMGRVHTYTNGVCIGCGLYDKELFSEPGLYGITDSGPVFRTSYLDIVEKTGMTISTEGSNVDGSHHAITLLDSGSVNPYSERYILVLPEEVKTIGRNQFACSGNGSSDGNLLVGIIAPGVTNLEGDAFRMEHDTQLRYFNFLILPKVESISKDGISCGVDNVYIGKTLKYGSANSFYGVGKIHYSGSLLQEQAGVSYYLHYRKLVRFCAY